MSTCDPKSIVVPQSQENKVTETVKRPSRRVVKGRAKISPGAKVALAIGIGIAALGAIYWWNNSGDRLAGKFPYQVGRPGPGQEAPPIDLPTTSGGTFSLAKMHGKTVLLYFQEGVTCQPCWEQIKDIDSHLSEFRALGIDTVATIAVDPISALKQVATDMKLSTPVLSDANLTVSKAYTANEYGMMGLSRDGHTFIVVGPDGRIEWRADYGGAPKYTMYLPVANLLADIRTGLRKTAK